MISHPAAHAEPADHGHFGMNPAVYALVFGILSGSSLPLASWLGIKLAPVSDKTCSMMMAFGAGALLFAVTVELFAHSLHHVKIGRMGLHEMMITIAGAFLGASFYLWINQWLEDYLMHNQEHEIEETGDFDVEETQFGAAQGESAPLMDALRKQNQQANNENEAQINRTMSSVSKLKKGVSLMKNDDLKRLRGREKAMRALHDPQEAQHAKSVAFALFLGLLVDGVPEGILMGFLAAEGHLTPVLIISLFVANFPEAFSSSSLLIQAQMSVPKIIGMWTGLCTLVGCLAGFSCWALLATYPDFGKTGGESLPVAVLIGISLVEGLTGGAMIACIAAVMLPEAFERGGKGGHFYSSSGFMCTAGFLLSATLKATIG